LRHPSARRDQGGRPTTEDVDEVEAWLSDETPGSIPGGAWEPAEPLVPNQYYRPNDPENSEGQELEVADRFYTDQDYELFGMLSKVRDLSQPGWFEDSGFPDDASDHVATEYHDWGVDAHTPGHATLADLEEHDWSTCPDFQSSVARLRRVANERCGGNADDARFVWWFDN
jgi:hypothetical protein